MRLIMKRFNKAAPILLLSCVALFSCVDEPVQIEEENLVYQIPQTNKVLTRSTSQETYETLPNPYALDVMQQVYDIYSESPVTLQPTDLYVKFMPKDSLELHTLKYECDLELFDYPLDIELAEGEEYINYDLPETDLVWLYTTVSPDYVFPQGISYEILEECYIPEDGETVGIPTKGGEVYVEDAAFQLVGYNESAPIETRSLATPCGTLSVHDNDNNSDEPIKGVKVRCHRLVKWATAYTDESGNYTMNKSFRYKPYYDVVFDNIKGFDIWTFGGTIGCARYSMGKQERSGFSCDIDTVNVAWDWAVINNSAYEYYRMCETIGIKKPPTDLKILNWNNRFGSSAGMIRRIEDAIGFNSNLDILNFYINFGLGLSINSALLIEVFRFVIPDITINTSNHKYARIYQVVNHELAHSSHFSQVGSEYWSKYISYIITYGAYGDGSGMNSQLCGIGEMWGNYIGYKQGRNRYDASKLKPMVTIDKWIYPQIFWRLDSEDVLSAKQIYNCLASDVDTYDELVEKMYLLSPDKATQIERILKDYSHFNYSVPVPDPVPDTIVNDVVYSSSDEITGDRISIQNVTVSNGASLTINAGVSVRIWEPFVVERGSSLLITKGN